MKELAAACLELAQASLKAGGFPQRELFFVSHGCTMERMTAESIVSGAGLAWVVFIVAKLTPVTVGLGRRKARVWQQKRQALRNRTFNIMCQRLNGLHMCLGRWCLSGRVSPGCQWLVFQASFFRNPLGLIVGRLTQVPGPFVVLHRKGNLDPTKRALDAPVLTDTVYDCAVRALRKLLCYLDSGHLEGMS